MNSTIWRQISPAQRFHETINALRAETWLATSELGYFVLDRDAATFFLRTKSATFPG